MNVGGVFQDHDYPVCAIVRLLWEARPVYYQITLDPSKRSGSKKFIHLGSTPGDQINGWTAIDQIEVAEILGKVEGDQVVPLPAKVYAA